MATITLARRHPGRKPMSLAAPVSFVWQDDTGESEGFDDSQRYTIQGIDAAGLTVALGGKCTLTALASSDTGKAVVQQVGQTTVKVIPLATGSVTITGTLTFNDASQGPYALSLLLGVSGQANVGLSVYPNGVPLAT